MARLMLLLLLAGCEEETTAFALDLTMTHDLSTPICSGISGGSCNVSPLDWCQPNASTEICVCAQPSQRWYCCDVDTYRCPIAPHNGDYCCPQASGFRQCGACSCVNGQFVCNTDAGTD
jgi:hypothetical protein